MVSLHSTTGYRSEDFANKFRLSRRSSRVSRPTITFYETCIHSRQHRNVPLDWKVRLGTTNYPSVPRVALRREPSEQLLMGNWSKIDTDHD